MKLIIGLGNPGEKYAETRHNIGHVIIDALVEHSGEKLRNHATGGFGATIQIGNEKAHAVKLSTFMNESGRQVEALRAFFKLKPEDIILIYDDIDLQFTTIRVAQNTSSGGHNGVQSVIDHLKSDTFTRLRIGIGPQVGSSENFVLQKWSANERKLLPDIVNKALQALSVTIEKGPETAATQFNQKNPE